MGANATAVEIDYGLSKQNGYPLPIHTVGTLGIIQKNVGFTGMFRYLQVMIGLEQTLPVVVVIQHIKS